MSASFMSRTMLRTVTLAAMVVAAGACSDQQITGNETPPAPVTANPSTVGMLRGTVREDGTVLLESLDPSIQVGDGASGAIYGNQNVTAKVTTSQFSVSTSGGTKTWKFKLAVHNLLDYPVGSIDGAATPWDTVGMYVFFPTAPTAVTPNPCSGCAISILNTQGSANFTQPGQLYYWYHDRLAAKGQPGDSTTNIPMWTFTAPSKVTSFRFTVILSSPWPRGIAGGDTTWSVFYSPSSDSFPTTNASPRWKSLGVNYGGDTSLVSGTLHLSAEHGSGDPSSPFCIWFHFCPNVSQDLFYVRSDNLSRTENAFIEAKIALTNGSSSRPVAIIAVADSIKFVGLGIANGKIGFVAFNSSTLDWEWLAGATFSMSTSGSHTYRVGKFGTRIATVYVDGVEKFSQEDLPDNFLIGSAASIGAQASRASSLFGITAQNADAAATISFVNYAIHATPHP